MNWTALKNKALISTALFLFACIPLFSYTVYNESQKITASDGLASDFFGISAALSGDTAIIGAYGNDVGVPGSNKGAAYIFKIVNGSFQEQAKLVASDGQANDSFGLAVSIDGDTAIVGSYVSTIGSNSQQGAAYIFKKNSNGDWVEEAKLTSSDGQVNELFGRSVSIKGDLILVGSSRKTIGSNASQGAAYIFRKNSNGQWLQEAKITSDDGKANDQFGFSVSLDGDTALVGAYSNDKGSVVDVGAAYVFKYDGNGNWIQEAKLTASDGAFGDQFGFTVSLKGDRALMGASLNNNARGAAYVFKRVSGLWGQEAKLTASDVAVGDRFATSVSLGQDIAVVGSPRNSNVFGSAYVYRYRDGLWQEDDKLRASDGENPDFLGFYVAVDNTTALIGAYADNIGTTADQGSVYIFAFDSDYDGLLNADDNCPFVSNSDQLDTDGDGQGDACDSDDDNDGVLDVSDNCPLISNADQLNADGDAFGDACDPDDDNDGVLDTSDNCPFVANPGQEDSDGDGAGNACDSDLDGDGVLNDQDNCPLVQNSLQEDVDHDNIGDACDLDNDNDGVADSIDNCDFVANPGQEDLDGDNIGDACDSDTDGDGFDNATDNCPLIANPGQDDADSDGIGNLCDPDDDNDGISDSQDNCPLVANPGQEDSDHDGIGNACDPDYNTDTDGDGYPDSNDNCPNVSNSDQNNFDGDAFGDVCDSDVDGDGVANGQDLCAQTPLGSIVDPASGCTINQLVPCNGPYGTTSSWKNHGQYVSTIGVTIKNFYKLGLITAAERDALQAQAAESSCGKK